MFNGNPRKLTQRPAKEQESKNKGESYIDQTPQRLKPSVKSA